MSQSEITNLTMQVEQLSKSVDYLVNRQKRQEELYEEMMPIAKLAMDATVERLDALERDGSMDFLRELAGIGTRIREGFSPDDVRQLGDATVSILDAVRALTRPEILRIAVDASEALEDPEKVDPIGVFGMVRATKSPDVQRGMALMMEVLRRIGQGCNALDAKTDAKTSKKASLARMLGPKRKALGTERRLPPARTERSPSRPASAPSETVRSAGNEGMHTGATIDGFEFCANGHLKDANAWTEELAIAIAIAEGLELTDAHWQLIRSAREEFVATGNSPNIRRLTLLTELSTRDIYALFPKAPGRAIARIAGCPKPQGCL